MREDPSAPERTRGRAFILAMLLIVYTFNFVDRQIVGILAIPIKAELGLSDRQLGLLGGLAFALLYATLGVPLAALADRTRRTWVITGSLAVWSAFTALCGLVAGFGGLFLARLGVGIGEAGGVAPSYALIADAFPPRSRARALAIYSLGIPLGSALGVLFGGYIAVMVNWRSAFLSIGCAGLLFAPIFAWCVPEPERTQRSAIPPAGDALLALLRKPSFWLLSLGAGSSSMLGYGLAFWLPSLLKRSFGLDLLATSHFFGALLLIGGTAGVLTGGWIGDRLGSADRGAYAKLPAIAFLIAVPLFAAGVLSHSPTVAFAFFLMPQALAYVWLGPVLNAVQHLVAPAFRATASASFLMINNFIGVGLGALTIGSLSDMLTPHWGNDALRIAILIALGFYVIAAILMASSVKYLRRDWVG